MLGSCPFYIGKKPCRNVTDNTALLTQDSKFKPWRSEAEHATSRSQRLPTILSFTSGWGRNIFVSFKTPRPRNKPRTPAWKAAVLTTTPGPPPIRYSNSSTRECCTGGEFVLKHWEKLNVSLLPNDEKTCKQSLIHNWKSNSLCVPVSTIHTVSLRDVWRPWHILLNRDL